MAYPTNPIYKFYKSKSEPSRGVIGVNQACGDHRLQFLLTNTEHRCYKEWKEWEDAGNTTEAAD